VYAGDTVRKTGSPRVEGGFVTLGGERFYRISRYDRMPPFFMSIVSHSDLWMFISSNGALTAGRKNPEHALFPYYTVDKIHDSHGITGSKTLILADVGPKRMLWEPFSREGDGLYDVERNLYKNTAGNKLLFEEENRDLNLVFQTQWTNSDRFGFVKRSVLRNTGSDNVACSVLDGIQNLLPYGTDRLIQTERSTLLDAYKKNELLLPSGLGLFLLSSIPVDKPEPSEALKATTVWSVGLADVRHLLSSRQVERFRNGDPVETETEVRAERGAYFVATEVTLKKQEFRAWYIVADVEQGPAEVAELRRLLGDSPALMSLVEKDVEFGTRRLRQYVAGADGLQLTSDELSSARHFANVLFNVMRGGTFVEGYRIQKTDLIDFIATHNSRVAERHSAFLESLPDRVDLQPLLSSASAKRDPDLTRLCHEYLPIAFSRRHGDPSRPWNYFSIDVKSDDGSPVFNYQGNWRDIFQNWEALCISYPEFAPGIISKFANASTADGYNPYRITRNGIDWERLDPSDPWSFIGYWGDHQTIYLLKLLEISKNHNPGQLGELLSAEEFAYANVPYRIKSYEHLLDDPHDTIEFDDDLDQIIAERVREVGADGRLLWNRAGEVQKANLTEKLLVSVLAKYSNFIPDGGIWMNTQRPEWNDANNALVGYGVSMVTLCYLRRFQQFARGLFQSVAWDEILIAEEVAEFLATVTETLRSHSGLLESNISDANRRRVVDELGRAGSNYRERVYAEGFSGVKVAVRKEDLIDFCDHTLRWTDSSIRANRRDDGLYHAYNLMNASEDTIAISNLYEMLEGQVAVLSSGLLSPTESVEVLDALRNSKLYRPDQYSYLLYPDRNLPRFEEKNVIPNELVESSRLLSRLLSDGDTRLVVRDVNGAVHFNGSFRNRHGVTAVLDLLAESDYGDEASAERESLPDLFESIFDHRAYTGRSGTFYGYEGLGCIYWHMVSKLLLAVAETYERALDEKADEATRGQLVSHYYSIRAGIGLNKGPELFGAFPTDPYSHTPANAGAKQPGMTGQVKEDILARWAELGVVVQDGCLSFKPSLLRESEFLTEAVAFDYFDVNGVPKELETVAGDLAFTYCQVPVVYRTSTEDGLRVVMQDGKVLGRDERSALSRHVFDRDGRIERIEVDLGPDWPA
jgi:hypothetical protein